MEHQTDANFIRHDPCPKCPSSDAFAVYDDGHGFCFSCEHYEPGRGGSGVSNQGGSSSVSGKLVNRGEVRAINSRGLTEETCETFGYKCAKVGGEPAQIAPYYDDSGTLVAQKLRFPDKRFSVRGDISRAMPFGSHAWSPTGKKIVVTEGEIDAMAMSQAQGNSYPVVSIPNGANSARSHIAQHRDYFRGFDDVVLMFDMDEEGREAAQEAAEVIPGRAKIAELPLKDPGEMLEEGRTEDLVNAMWNARDYQPQGIVSMSELVDEALEPPEWGLSWPFETLTELTYGMRTGELYALGAGTGVGKTSLITETAGHLLQEHDEKVGIFALEQEPEETAVRLAGKMVGKPLHVPDVERDTDEVREAFQAAENRVYMYDSFGAHSWEPIKAKIEYLYHSEGVQYFFLDHITAIAASITDGDERKALDRVMSDLGGLVKKIPICITFVSHLATPGGKPHEEGGRVMIRHFRGSRSIGFWSHFIFGLERDQQADSEAERMTTTFRVLKDRYTGRSTGEKFYFTYDEDTGLLSECGPPPSERDDDEPRSVHADEEREDAEDFGFA